MSKPPSDDGTPSLDDAAETAEGYPRGSGAQRVREISKAKLIDLVRRAEEERGRLNAARQRVEAQERRLGEDIAKLERELAGAGQRAADALVREQAALEGLKALIERVQGLADANQELRRATADRLAAEAAQAVSALEAATLRAREHEETMLRDAGKRAADLVAEAANSTAGERAELESLRLELERRARDLERRATGQVQLEAQIREDAEFAVADELERLRKRLHSTEGALRQAREEARTLGAKQQEQRDQAIRIGDRTPAEITGELARLERRAAAAEEERDRRPPASIVAELDAALRRATDAEQDADQLRAELAQGAAGEAARRRLSSKVVELEQENEELEESRVRMQRRIGELRADLELLGDASDAEPPDSDLLAIDALSRRREADEVRWRRTALTLAAVLGESQARMAAAGLFYSTDDLRLFIAGLAAAQLHILEGISGTGKTSLPIAFADAVGGSARVVEVQAAWRDRLDLMGSYNAFDRRYYPTDFARALYHAATPGWSDTICLIVLDEMNLAHPEHYFADVLSAMESGKGRVEALPRAIGQAAALLEQRSVPFGDNVWFVGTANRDETTSSIADKTYDRANVMELPERHAPLSPGDPGADDGAIRVTQLRRLFVEAERHHSDATNAVLGVTRDEALRVAATNLRIGFGNRLERIIRRFAPVVVATGGTSHDALDHLLATKLVRKLESRFDARTGDLNALEAALETAAGAPLDRLPRTARELSRQRERLEA